MTSRRSAMLAALGLAAALPAIAAKTPRSGEAVGDYAIKRNKYAIASDFTIPRAATVTMIPFNVVRFEEAGFCRLLPNGMVEILQTGLYRVCLGLDWKAQEQRDTDTRLYGIRRKVVGDDSAPALSDERLASFDHPGSDSPVSGRFAGTWQPPQLAPGAATYVDVTVNGNGQIKPGDVASASLGALATAAPEVQAFVSVRAVVIDQDRVRVLVANTGATAVSLASGSLKVLAQSTTEFRGESEDAWNVLSTPLVELIAGEKLYVIGKNQGYAGDYIQASNYSTFLQVEKFG